jgi:aromatic ring-cleaving dioxygenase
VQLGRWHDRPIGPHPKSMYQAAFAVNQLDRVVPWLMLHHENLDILIPYSHDSTNDGNENAAALPLTTKLAASR